MNTTTICYVAGKSGGHIIPCLTLAQKNKAAGSINKILFFSANTPLDKTILADNTMVSWHIMLPLSNRTQSYIKLLLHTVSSFMISFFYLYKHKPTEIITTGGIVAIPTCIAGFILRIPITLYSLDAIPGKAIKALSPLARSIITPFTTSKHYFTAQKCSRGSYPIKYDSSTLTITQQEAQRNLKLSLTKKTILILGGSQGSLFLNDCIKQWINDETFNAQEIQIIHQTGSRDNTNWQELYISKNITAHVFDYYPDLALMYTASDLIICRAGAGTLFEIKFFNKPCIVIPLITTTTSHQVNNALAMEQEYPQLFYTIMQKDVEQKYTLLFNTINNIISKKIF